MNNLNIGIRLGGAFAAVILLMAIMLGSMLWQLDRIAEAKEIMAQTGQKTTLAKDWLEDVSANSVRFVAKLRSNVPGDDQYYDERIATARAKVAKVQEQLQAMVDTPEGKTLLERALENDNNWYALGDAGFERKAELGGEHPEVQAFFKDKVAPQMRAYIASLDEMVAYQTSLSEQAQADIDALQRTGRNLLLGVGAFALGTGARVRDRRWRDRLPHDAGWRYAPALAPRPRLRPGYRLRLSRPWMPESNYTRYLKENGKHEVRRWPIKLPYPKGAHEKLHELTQKPWLWGAVVHNCTSSAEEVVRAGGSKAVQYFNCPIAEPFA
ncbi:MCP four helix bundle domain-containing protein [Massilia alkalitolerans]|uniref:MCP four helix bundle domain-containing protein n=1 Tax=Massilia alkalitolerans TaxID=286638 RepID=UPI0028A8A8D7|nr:MCP four helix bundle domain-containing protein [Massilia alkalitolerans]